MAGDARFLLIASVRDEGPNLLEWIAHHRTLGFTDIVLAESGSFDLSDRMLRVLAREGVVRPLAPGPSALREAARLPAYAAADWALVLDPSEYLCVATGQGGVADLVAAVGPGVDEIRLHWRLFGSNRERRLGDGLVTERFTRAAPAGLVTRAPHPVRTLFRPSGGLVPGPHLPRRTGPTPPAAVTGSGVPLARARQEGALSTDPGGYALAQVNRYAVRDAESFLVRAAADLADPARRAARLAYWRACDRNDEEDRRLADRAHRTRAAMREIDVVSGGRLLAMRGRSLKAWRRRLDGILAGPGAEAFRADLG